jgi:hypothetical protein
MKEVGLDAVYRRNQFYAVGSAGDIMNQISVMIPQYVPKIPKLCLNLIDTPRYVIEKLPIPKSGFPNYHHLFHRLDWHVWREILGLLDRAFYPKVSIVEFNLRFPENWQQTANLTIAKHKNSLKELSSLVGSSRLAKHPSLISA